MHRHRRKKIDTETTAQKQKRNHTEMDTHTHKQRCLVSDTHTHTKRRVVSVHRCVCVDTPKKNAQRDGHTKRWRQTQKKVHRHKTQTQTQTQADPVKIFSRKVLGQKVYKRKVH